jgi:hypothetical protein
MMKRKARGLVVPLVGAVALVTGIAVAGTTSVTITSPKANQTISAKNPYTVVAGGVTFAPATAASTKFYLRRDGCGTSNDNPHLSVTSGTDKGSGCGFIGGNGFLSTADPSLFSVDYPTTDGMPLALDAGRPIQGVLDLKNSVAGVGQVTLDFTAEALVHGEGVVIGTDTERVLVNPTVSDYPVPFQITQTRQLDQADLSGIDLHVYIHGAYSESGYIGNSGNSWLTVPSYTASTKRSVLVSLDDQAFGRPSSATIDKSFSSWYLAIPTPALGKHTVYVESKQGFDTSSVVSSSFTVKNGDQQGGNR